MPHGNTKIAFTREEYRALLELHHLLKEGTWQEGWSFQPELCDKIQNLGLQLTELMNSLKAPAVDASKVVQARIAVAIDSNGRWLTGGNSDQADAVKEPYALRGFRSNFGRDASATHWLNVNLPIPQDQGLDIETWVEEKAKEWNTDPNEYHMKALGKWPEDEVKP